MVVGPPVSTAPREPFFPPAAGGDANPIRISIGQLDLLGNIVAGSLRFRSAERFGATSPPLVIQYWSLALNGATVTGTLVDNGAGSAAAANLLASTTDLPPCIPMIQFPNQDAITVGATVTGTITATEVRLGITGNTTNGLRPFVAGITATRTA